MNDFHDLMRAHDPARDLPEVSPVTRIAILDRAVGETEPADVTPLPTTSRATQARSMKTHVTRRLLLSGGWKAAVAVAAGSLVVAGVTQLGPTGSASAEASQVLFLAAGAATDPPARADQWWEISSRSTVTSTLYANYVKDQTTEADGSTYLIETRRVTYESVDGARPSWYDDKPYTIVRLIDGPEITPEPSLPYSWTSNLSPNEIQGSWQLPNPVWLAELPRDTQALRARLYADSSGHGTGDHDSAYTYAADVLRTGLVPADLRASLFRVIETIPGTKITDAAAVVDGRTGVAIGRANVFGVGYELVFDQATGELIGERSRAEGIPGWERVYRESSYSRRVVDEIPAQLQRDAQRMKCTTEGGGVGCVPEEGG